MTFADEVRARNENKDSAETVELRKALKAAHKKLAAAKHRTDELIEAVYQAARDAALVLGPPAKVTAPKLKRSKNEEMALAHLTDLQFGKQTSGYSMEVCLDRVKRFGDKIEKLTDIQRADHPVNEIHIMLGGDMVEGTGIFPGQVYEIEAYLYEQMFGCARLIEDFVRRALGSFARVVVWEESGNHGRLGKKGEQPTEDNVDRMCYRIARDRIGDDDRLTWHAQDNWYKMVHIGEYTALLVHGDEIKSFGGNLPAYGILRKCNAWSSGVVEPFIDAYMGHFHTPMSLTLANGGRVFVSGSPESDSVYAQEFVAAKGRPSQRLHFIDPRAGRVTSEHTIWLD